MDLLSEEEQWERLKAWLRTNGPSILGLTALMLIGWFGWKWWQGQVAQKSLDAGAIYENIQRSFDAGTPNEALALIETLRDEYPGSPYVDAADMLAVNVHVASNELDKAEERLRRVSTGAKDEQLRPVARLRLARVQSAKGQYDEALATLGTTDMGAHEPARLEVRGDVLYAKGEREEALASYRAARQLLPEGQLGESGVGELLDLKIADLAGAPVGAPASGPEEPADQP